MGRPKALLPFKQSTFSRSLVQSFNRAGFDPVYVVVGHDSGPIISHLSDLGVRFVYNADWPKGQLSSIRAAIRACPKGTGGLMVALVDQPGVRASSFKRLCETHRKNPRNILVAARRGRPGHPVVFPKRFFGELLAAPDSGGARVVVRRHARDRTLVPLSDPAVLRDVDTPHMLVKLVRVAASSG
ncbi:nucleotidyltransferase family protein [bacterium]|nr:nucleotidyltransferase family protein [bacterium]